MGRLRVLTGREVCRILTDAGSVTVPIPDHREIAIGTLSSTGSSRCAGAEVISSCSAALPNHQAEWVPRVEFEE